MTLNEETDVNDTGVLKDFFQSREFYVYLSAAVASSIWIAVITDQPTVGIFWGGWIGLFVMIAVNELTPGFTMSDTDQ